MSKRALQLASVASMIDLFNSNNIDILHSLGYKVDVATNFYEGSITSQERVNEYRNELKSNNIDTYNIPIPRSVLRIKDIIASYKMVKKLVKEKKYNIVHCHSPIGGVICRLACKKGRLVNKTKVIYTAHGFHFFKGAPIKSWLCYYPVEKWCSKYTDVLITINREDFKNAKKMNAHKVIYIPGIGIDTNAFRDVKVDKKTIRSQLGLKNEDFVFLSTGQISVRKNHEVIIRALAKIKDESVKYVIVGFGEEEKRLKQLVDSLGLTKRVIFAGYRSDVKEILHVVDAFVFPSLQEGLPISLMEAMAAGLPIIASRIRGNVDLIDDGKGGYLFDCFDINGFSNGMKHIIHNDNSSLINYNLKKIKKFDSKLINKYMSNIYKML